MYASKSSGANIRILTTTALVFLWALSSSGKIADLDEFKRELNYQVFSPALRQFLAYAVPTSEATAALLLVWCRTRLIGLAYSAGLLIIFSGYISLILLGFYDKVPCSCISVVKGMGFKTHLFFNLCFIAVALTGFILTKKERRNSGMDKQMSHAPLTRG